MATSVFAADALPTTLPPDFGEWDDHNEPADPDESVLAQPPSECASDLAPGFTSKFTFDLAALSGSQPVPEYTPEYTFDRTSQTQPAAGYMLRYTPEHSFDPTPEPAPQPAADSSDAVMPPPVATAPEQLAAPVPLAASTEFDAPRIRSAAPPQKIYTCQQTFLDQLLAMPFDPAAPRRDAALDSESPLAIYEVQPADRASIDIGAREPAEPAGPASSPAASALNSSAPPLSAPELFNMVQPRKVRAAKTHSLEAGNESGSRTRKWIFTLGAIFAVTCALSFFGVLFFFGTGRSHQAAPVQSAHPQPAPSTVQVSTAPVILTASKPSPAQRTSRR